MNKLEAYRLWLRDYHNEVSEIEPGVFDDDFSGIMDTNVMTDSDIEDEVRGFTSTVEEDYIAIRSDGNLHVFTSILPLVDSQSDEHVGGPFDSYVRECLNIPGNITLEYCRTYPETSL